MVEKTDIVDLLMRKSNSPAYLKIIQMIFNTAIAFSSPHKIQFKKLDDDEVILKLPHIRKNQNHLGTVHACALATVGEYTCGLILAKNLNTKRYRYVLSKMELDYMKQAVGEVTARSSFKMTDKEMIFAELNQNGQAYVSIESTLTNKDSDVICRVKTLWQLKDWSKATKSFK